MGLLCLWSSPSLTHYFTNKLPFSLKCRLVHLWIHSYGTHHGPRTIGSLGSKNPHHCLWILGFHHSALGMNPVTFCQFTQSLLVKGDFRIVIQIKLTPTTPVSRKDTSLKILVVTSYPLPGNFFFFFSYFLLLFKDSCLHFPSTHPHPSHPHHFFP